MTAPRVGDRVRLTQTVTYEGTVTYLLDDGRYGVDDYSPEVQIKHNGTRSPITVEVLAPAERQWEPGDVVMDAEGDVAERRDSGRWWCNGEWVRDADLVRPLIWLTPQEQT